MLLNVHEAFYIMIPCIRAPGEDMTRVFSYAHQSCGCRGGFSFRTGGNRFILNVMWLRWELVNLL